MSKLDLTNPTDILQALEQITATAKANASDAKDHHQDRLQVLWSNAASHAQTTAERLATIIKLSPPAD